MPHQQKPDIDNLCKSVMDALSDDDAYIHELHAMKFWDYRGTIEINDLWARNLIGWIKTP